MMYIVVVDDMYIVDIDGRAQEPYQDIVHVSLACPLGMGTLRILLL